MAELIYGRHFGLREAPFGITPDASFAYDCRAHQEAFNVLMVALRTGEGFIKVTGEVGTGKTMLCRRVLAALGDEYVVCYLPNPLLEPRGLLVALGRELGLQVSARDDPHQSLAALNGALVRLMQRGMRAVVLIDEAQAMPLATLETLRLLSNLETDKSKLLQVVLVGQPELDRNLENPLVRQLRQRIGFHYVIDRLARRELGQYIRHRLQVAGCARPPVFSALALWFLYRASRGVPRLVNILVHKALLLTYARGEGRVGIRQVMMAARDTSSASRILIPWLV